MKSFIADKNRKLSKLALYNVEDLSFSAFMKALRKKDIKVNGKRVSEDVFLNVGDVIEVYYVAQKVDKYSVLFADENVIVINKKKGYTSESVYDDILSKNNNVYVIIVGDKKSHNTNSLYEIAIKYTNNVIYILDDSDKELNKVINSNLNTVVIASGTSTPIEIVNKIINKIK